MFIIDTIARHRNELGIRRGSAAHERGAIDGKVILLAAVTVYLFTQLPQVINDTLAFLSFYPFCVFEYIHFYTVYPVAATLAWIAYSVNFYLYFACSKKFRNHSKLLLDRISKGNHLQKRSEEAIGSTANNTFQRDTTRAYQKWQRHTLVKQTDMAG